MSTLRYPATSPEYQRTLDWLYSFVNSEKQLPSTSAEFNLPRTQALLGLLGDPQLRYPAVVIAGSKGKGSTAVLIEAIARAAGLRTGLYTSPHLHSFRERMQVGRAPISQAQLVALVEATRPLIDQLPPALGHPSTYEIATALALRFFAEQKIELAVLEIGLGGRYDSVNVVTPLVSVIASISLDHTAVLGSTLGAIAGEKAGIIKPGVPVVTIQQHPEAHAVIERVAGEQGAPLAIALPEGLHMPDGALVPHPVSPSIVGLPGSFQQQNAALALGTALLLRGRGLTLPDAALTEGLTTAKWPARMEQLQSAPPVITDGAHNADSAAKLLAALRERYHFRRLLVVFGSSRDKDIEGMATQLLTAADVVLLAYSRHPRALELEQLEQRVRPSITGTLLHAGAVPDALRQALELAAPDDLICVTGSLFIAAEAREVYGLGEPD